MARKVTQVDKDGYLEGLHTGFKKGYSKGLKDALFVCQTMLEENGIYLSDSEFQIQMQIMTDEGEIHPYQE